VVIPTRNRRLLLEEAVQSVRRQTVAVRECIIVNDGSVDDTREFLDSVEGPGMVVASVRTSLGHCAARNLGLQRASGDLVLFLDDDDMLERTAIEVLSGALLEHSEAIGAIGGRTIFDGQARRRRIRCTRAAAVRYVGPEVLAGWYAVPGQCLFRTHMLQRVGGWDEELRVAEDQDLLLRLDRHGPVVLIRDLVLGNRAHGSNRHPPAGAVERAIRDRYVAQLEGTNHRMAERFMVAGEELAAANEAYRRGDYRSALTSARTAMATAPQLSDSPTIGPHLNMLMRRYRAGALLGPRLSSIAKGIGRSVRHVARRDPGGSARG
jgi:glycosyltransferase involved in cell wall biosynthesis